VMELVLNAENLRMLVLLVFGYSGYVMLKTSFEKRLAGLEVSLNKRIDGLERRMDALEVKVDRLEKRMDALEVKVDRLERRMDALEKRMDVLEVKIDERFSTFYAQLKANDFAHLNNSIEALTFTLEKNKFLEREDKEYIDGRLDR